MSEVEHRPLDRGAGPLLRGWRLGEREGEGGKWAAINPHTLPLAARLAVLSTISPNALDIPAATGTLPVAPNPLAALFDNHDVLALSRHPDWCAVRCSCPEVVSSSCAAQFSCAACAAFIRPVAHSRSPRRGALQPIRRSPTGRRANATIVRRARAIGATTCGAG